MHPEVAKAPAAITRQAARCWTATPSPGHGASNCVGPRRCPAARFHTLRRPLLLLATLALARLLVIPTAADAAPRPTLASYAQTVCTLTLTPPTLAIACTGPGHIALAPIDPSATGITNISLSGSTLKPDDPICATQAVVAAAVTICSTAADLTITQSTIRDVVAPSVTRTVPAAAIAVLSGGPSLQVSNLTASGVTGGSALLIRAAATAGANITVANCRFTGNNAGHSNGGGLSVELLSQPAGALAANPSRLVLRDNVFVNNSAASGGGVAVRLMHNAAVAGGAAHVPVSVSLQGSNSFQGHYSFTGQNQALGPTPEACSGHFSLFGGGLALYADPMVKIIHATLDGLVFDGKHACSGGGESIGDNADITRRDWAARRLAAAGTTSAFVVTVRNTDMEASSCSEIITMCSAACLATPPTSACISILKSAYMTSIAGRRRKLSSTCSEIIATYNAACLPQPPTSACTTSLRSAYMSCIGGSGRRRKLSSQKVKSSVLPFKLLRP